MNLITSIFSLTYGLFSISIVLIITVVTLIGNWKMFVKAGKPGWACLIPFYSQYCMFDFTFGTGWLFLLMFVPCVNLVIAIMLPFKLAKAFGQGTAFGFGLLFLNAIFVLILGYGSNYHYIGVDGVNPYASSNSSNSGNDSYYN